MVFSVRDIATDEDVRVMVRAIIWIALGLNFITLAEGVETSAQRHLLQWHHCDEVQGLLHAKPMVPTLIGGCTKTIRD